MTFYYTRVPGFSGIGRTRGYEISGSLLRFMLRKSSLVECVSVLHGTCLQNVDFFLFVNMCSHVCQKIVVHILYHKELADARILNIFWHTDNNFCFYVEVNFWDFVRNDNSKKGTTARLNQSVSYMKVW